MENKMSENQTKLEHLEDDNYRFKYPRYVNSLDEQIFDAVDFIDAEEFSKAKDILHSVIDAYPEHIDALHHLAVCLREQGEFKVAFNLWEKAVETGLGCFPKHINLLDMRLEWGWLENRPFLRAYEALGVDLYEQDRVHEALDIFTNLLAWNPNDNQGIRALAAKANFDLQRPDEVLKICDMFPEDGLSDTFYGRLLALFQLKQEKKLDAALKAAIEFLPSIAEELVKSRHTEFDGLLDTEFDEEKEEALVYWENYGQYWQETPGALDFLRNGLKKYAKPFDKR